MNQIWMEQMVSVRNGQTRGSKLSFIYLEDEIARSNMWESQPTNVATPSTKLFIISEHAKKRYWTSQILVLCIKMMFRRKTSIASNKNTIKENLRDNEDVQNKKRRKALIGRNCHKPGIENPQRV